MQVEKIRIRNVLGIDSFELSPGQFTAIVGPNGSGKTSVLEAIKAALGGGHDVSLLRKGAERGDVVLLLDDGTEIRKDVSADETKVSVKDPKYGSKMSEPRKVIASLFDPSQLNPVSFLAARGKDRLGMLLEAIPMKLDGKAVEDAVAGISDITVPATGHALQIIDKVRQQVFDGRTGCNRALREKTATANELQATVPTVEELAGDWSAKAKKVTEDLAGAREMLTKRLAQVDVDATNTIKELAGEEAAEIEAIRARFAAKRQEIVAGRDQVKESMRTSAAEAIDRLSKESATAAERLQSSTKSKAQLELLGKMRLDVARLETESKKLTAAIDQLEALKVQLVAKLPIQGLEVREGEIYIDGVAFDRINTSQQIKFAIELAKLRAGKLKLVVVDGLERMDAEFFKAFEAAAKATDIQWIVTRVTDGGELRVTTEGELPARKEVGVAAVAAEEECPI